MTDINLVAVTVDFRRGREAAHIHVPVGESEAVPGSQHCPGKTKLVFMVALACGLAGELRQAVRRNVHKQIAGGDHKMLLQGRGNFYQSDASTQIPQIKSVSADGDVLCDRGYDLDVVRRRKDRT